LLNKDRYSYIFLASALLSLVVTYIVTIGSNPLLTDDSPQALVNRTPNIINHAKLDVILGKVQIKECIECFEDDSFISNKKIQNGLNFSKTQPFLYYQNANTKYPILLSRKMSAFPFLFLKTLSQYTSVEIARNIYNIICLTLTLIFSFLVIRLNFGNNTAVLYAFLCSFSPLFISSYTGYVSEQLIAPIFWITSYCLLRKTNTSFIISLIFFLFGIFIKLNFLVSLVPMYFLTRGSEIKIKKYVSYLIIAFVYFVFLLSLKNGTSELFLRGGEGYTKPISHLLVLFQEIVAMISQSMIYLNDPLAIKDIHSSYYENVSYETLSSIRYWNYFFILIFGIGLFKEKSRNLSLIYFLWCILCFVVGHIDTTYSLRFSETISFLLLIFSITICNIKIQKNSKTILLTLLSIFWIGNFLAFYNYYRNIGPNSNQKLSFFKNISSDLLSRGIVDPILYYDENEWGYLEYLSGEKITPFYAQGLERRLDLEKIFMLNQRGHVLINLGKSHMYDSGNDVYFNESEESIERAAKLGGAKLKKIHSYFDKDIEVYRLIYFENKIQYRTLSLEDRVKLEKIEKKYNFR